MSVSFRHTTVRLDRRRHEQLEEVARTRGTTPSGVIREAIDLFLGNAELATASDRRLARIGEFQHLALDVIIREQFPEFRDRIVAETDRRMEQYHGAR